MSAEDKYKHYFKDVSKLDTVDIYAVCDLFSVRDTSGATQHAIKKILCSGQRGVKGELKDLQEAIDTLQRRVDMLGGVPIQGFTPVGEATGKKFLEDAYDEPENGFDLRDALKRPKTSFAVEDYNNGYYEE